MALLSSDICQLRPVNEQDIEQSLAWRNDIIVKKNLLSFRLPITKPMEKGWIQNAMKGNDKTRIVFSIDDLEHNHIGFIELNSIDYFNRNGQYAIVIGDSKSKGKGFAFAATQLILEYGFNQLNLHKISLQVAKYNIPALQLYKKVGFGIEGELIEQHFIDGKYHNMICMAIFAKDFIKS